MRAKQGPNMLVLGVSSPKRADAFLINLTGLVG